MISERTFVGNFKCNRIKDWPVYLLIYHREITQIICPERTPDGCCVLRKDNPPYDCILGELKTDNPPLTEKKDE